MSRETTPIFVIGSGRSGTRAIYKMLLGIPSIEIYHEYLCTHIQRPAALHYMGVIGEAEIKDCLRQLHGAGIYYSKAEYFVDCSNKLSWLIAPLIDLYPRAKFVNLVRDGRKVASSFFHKLADEMYDDVSVAAVCGWLADRQSLPMPPPEKKYWWNVPQPGQPFAAEFLGFDQFQRVCYHWREANRVIIESLKEVPADQQLIVRLEDLKSDLGTLQTFLAFFGLEYEEHFRDFLQRPQNVIFPMDFPLTEAQLQQFNVIASDMMKELGYDARDEYRVTY